MLLNAAAKIDAQNNKGNTPLHLAAQESLEGEREQDDEIIGMLVPQEADIPLTPKDGHTPCDVYPLEHGTARGLLRW